MSAGTSKVFLKVYAILDDDPDLAGGAMLTGSYVGDIAGRMHQISPSTLLQQQGVEIRELFSISVGGYPSIPIKEYDQLEVVGPFDNDFVGLRLKINSVTRSSVPKSDSRYRRQIVAMRVEQSRGTGV